MGNLCKPGAVTQKHAEKSCLMNPSLGRATWVLAQKMEMGVIPPGVRFTSTFGEISVKYSLEKTGLKKVSGTVRAYCPGVFRRFTDVTKQFHF